MGPGAGTDLFISYAWTSDGHREWVRLLAANLKAIGFDVLIDADVDYGDSLNGFMRRVSSARHVLMIADRNYVKRANKMPKSGVGVENQWIRDAYADKPATWLSVLFKDNPAASVPSWLKKHNPKGFSFHAAPATGDFPGSEQVEELWRWIEDLPSNKDNATPLATLRNRAARLERSALKRDPAHWRKPALSGDVHFPYNSTLSKTCRMGFGVHEFALQLSERSAETVAVYADPIDSVGRVRSEATAPEEWEAHLTPARTVDARPGDTVVLMNKHGVFCRVDITAVQSESSGPPYVEPHIDFHYEVITGS